MTYRLAFIDEINRLGARDLVLRPRYFTGTPYVGDTSAGVSMRGGTYDGTYYRPGLLTVSPASRNLSPWSWSASHSSPSVTVDPSVINPEGLRRGSVWELVAFTANQSGPLWVGFLADVALRKDSNGHRYDLNFTEITGMQARAAPDDSDLTLFSYAGRETTLSNNFSTSHANLRLTSTADCIARTTNLGVIEGLIRVEPSGGGAAFLMAWNAKTSARLTRDGAARYGTTLAAASAGDTAVPLGFYEGHPSRFAREIYTGSSPAGTRSVSDSGFLKLPEDLFDGSDTEVQLIRTPDLDWGFWTDKPIRMDDVSRWLGIGGWWLTMRHGRVTCRTFPDLGAYWESVVSRPTYPGPGRYVINFADLATRGPGRGPIKCESSIYGGGSWQSEYLQVAVKTQAGTFRHPASGLTSRRGFPVQQELAIDLDNREESETAEFVMLFPPVGDETWRELVRRFVIPRVSTDMPGGGPAMYATTANGAELAKRIAPWAVHAPQIIRCTVAGPHPEYTIGDSVLLGDDWDLPSAVGGTVAGLYGMIAGVSMDILGLTNTITIWVPPQQEIPQSAGSTLFQD